MTFIVDVNLPGFLWKFKTNNFIFVTDTNKELSDSEIWKLAINNNYVILTTDMDFYFRAKQSINFPKIVIFRFGNMKLKAMYQYFDQYWYSIAESIQQNKLIFAWQNELEVVY